MRIALFATVAACALVGAGAAFAADDTPAVEALVVNGQLEQLIPQELAKVGVRVDTIEAAEIRDRGYVDVATTLQSLVPGLQVNAKNGPFDYVDISLQGSRTQDVLWLIDGVRINNRLYAGTTPLDTVPASMVERIEVLEGGQGLFYGTQGIAGAVNVVTRGFSETPRGSVTLGGGGNNSGHADGFYSNSYGPHQLVLYASADRSSGYNAFSPQDYQPSATDRDRGYKVLTAGLKYGIGLGDKTRLSATYQYTGADLDFAMPFRVASNVNARREYIATGKLDTDISENVSLYLKAYYHWWHTSYDTTYNSLTSPGSTEVIYSNAIWGFDDSGANALARIKTGGLESFVGYEYQAYGGKDDVLVIEKKREHTHALFGQVRTTRDMFENGRIALGVRHSEPSVGEASTIWNLSGQYDFGPNLFVRGNGGTNFRLPTAEELFSNDPFFERGNPDLKPERSTNLNASVGGQFNFGGIKDFRWEVIGFSRSIEDLIDLDTFDAVTGQDVFGNLADTVRVRGGEIVLDGDVSPSVSMRASYTHSKSTLKGSDDQLNRIPRDQAKASIDFHPMGSAFGASAAVTWTGDIFTVVDGVRINYGEYSVLDVAMRYYFDAEHHNRLNLSVENLLDKEYGRPQRGCGDAPGLGPFDCPVATRYVYTNLGLPRTVRVSFTHEF